MYVGLDINKHTILEMACIVTDEKLDIIAEVSNKAMVLL